MITSMTFKPVRLADAINVKLHGPRMWHLHLNSRCHTD